ncbi:DUF3095 domain-containing protein [Sedimentitalea sp. JM2-8]|uniref:DUF3095 domain-containing protein n=2 Tax=Sedimentitalea xiamensis TaxID=3050037 RepID=A0ABT7FKE7_9RHOB|nr:DUF3095 domain-containing protein [Sedimentitalea xiamensis]
MTRNDTFYDTLPRVGSFAALAKPDVYTPLPNDWTIGAADIVGSTDQIAKGRYKTVNMVGAAVISSQINASGGKTFPYVFGGDGATFACDTEMAALSARALGVMKRWASEEFGLDLRVAQVPVADIRAAGRDVRVARFRASDSVDYGMFSGGGISWAESEMKRGRFALSAAPAGAIPDLTGLSCRWNNAKSRNGSILSVVIEPELPGPRDAFAAVASQVIALADTLERGGHPLPPDGPGVSWPPPGLDLDAHVSRGAGSLRKRKIQLLFGNLIAWLFFKSGVKAGAFDPAHYARMVSNNADFRKFDDGLKMTLDCDPDTIATIRSLLERAERDGILRFGLFEQAEAMMTCFVPSVTQDNHIHLVDGASGGYAQAAARLKSVSR